MLVIIITLALVILLSIFISNPGKCIFLLKSIWSHISSRIKRISEPKSEPKSESRPELRLTDIYKRYDIISKAHQRPKIQTIPFYFKLLKYDVNRKGWICVGSDNSVFFSELFIEWREYPSFEEITNYSKKDYLSRVIKRDLLRNCHPVCAVDLRHSDKIHLKGWEEMKMNEALE